MAPFCSCVFEVVARSAAVNGRAFDVMFGVVAAATQSWTRYANAVDSRVSMRQAVVVPCGITAQMNKERQQAITAKCEELLRR